ncbi:MAG: BRCT domain-containing protein, partial [Thermaerobacterales bacterium]
TGKLHGKLARAGEQVVEDLSGATGADDAEVNRSLAGKSFVLTGTLSSLSRQEAAARIEALGGRVTGSVSRHTDFVVAGGSPGSKLDRARELGITILDEEAFLGCIETQGRQA